jgi:hypothetical protein
VAAEEEPLPLTFKEGGHALMVEYGDCEFYGSCQCGVEFGMTRPDQRWDETFGTKWEQHVLELEKSRR